MGSLETRAEGSLNSPQHSSGSEQQISHRCHQADEVKQCENDMDWRPAPRQHIDPPFAGRQVTSVQPF